MVRTLTVNATRGEVTPLMHARVDTEFYQQSLAQGRNVVVTRYGPLLRVPGTLREGTPKQNTVTIAPSEVTVPRPYESWGYEDSSVIALSRIRFLPFEFNEDQIYAVEAGNGYFRFWTPEGQVLDSGSPYEIVSPFETDDLPALHSLQIGDTLYLFSLGRKRIYILKRLGETNWTVDTYNTMDGPWLDLNTQGVIMTPANNGSFVPKMTANNAPSGTVAASGGTDPYKVFDQSNTTDYTHTSSTGWLSYTPASGTRVMDAYWMKASAGTDPSGMPSSWRIEGYDGTNWIVLDTRDSEQGWGRGERRYYEFENETAFQTYRIAWDGTSSSSAATRINEMGWHQRAETQTAFNLTASATTGINGGSGFLTSDVGRVIRLRGSDGKWRWARIIARTSSTVVTIQLYGHALPSTERIAIWQLGAFSDYTGWPFTGILYEDRLALAGSNSDPIGMWFTRNGGYDNFGQSDPLVDDDGITIRLTGGRLNPVTWLAEAGVLLAGTVNNIRSVANRDNQSALSPTNIRQKAETAVPASEVRPATTENVTLFIDRNLKRLYETGYDYNSDAYLAREVSTLNEHLFRLKVVQLVYLDAPHKFALGRRFDGKVIFFAYDREQKIAGATLCDFGGFVQDIMVMPGREYPDVWMSVVRQNAPTTTTPNVARISVERLAPFWREGDEAPNLPVYAAAAATYHGAATNGLSGLSWLGGHTVGIWADGRDIGDAVVDNSTGTVTLPFGITATDIVVGLRMPWKIQTLRLPTYGQNDGSGLGRKMTIAKAFVDVFESQGVYGGSLGDNDNLITNEADIEDNPDLPVPLLTGMFPIHSDDSFQNGGVFVIQGDRMFPATIRAISLEVEGEP